MRIVDVCAFYAPEGGGVRTYVEQKLAAGPRYGHEIIILAPGPETRSERRGPNARIEWVAAPRLPVDSRYRYFAHAADIHRRLDALAPDFVEASSPWRSATAVASWAGPAPRALVMHADPFAAYAYRWLAAFGPPWRIDRALQWAWRYLRRLDHAFQPVISASASLTVRLSEQGLRNVVTVPMGIDSGFFSPALRDEALRTRLLADCALPQDATLLLGVGRHAPEKRWPMLIDAVTAAGSARPIGFVLVGEGRETPHIARQARGNPHIRLLAPIADRRQLARLMASCDALLHGCEAETFSMVAAEAVASGLPLIVPDRGGAADHAAANGGWRYAAGSGGDAVRAIRAFALSRARRAQPSARTMAEHFRDLFALYDARRAGLRLLQ